MYVAVKGGERAIESAHAWLAEERRGDTDVAELRIAQIREQLKLAVDRVMAEGSLYDPDLAALAIKQSRGDLIEAIFLIRAYRTTLPRFGASRPMDTGAIINSVMKTNRLVTVEEGWPQGSVGSYISSVVMQEAFDYLDAPVINCTGKDVPMPYAANLEKLALITTDEVIAAVKQVTYR